MKKSFAYDNDSLVTFYSIKNRGKRVFIFAEFAKLLGSVLCYYNVIGDTFFY